MSTIISLEALRARSLLYQNLREFFKSRQVFEVETPVFANVCIVAPSKQDRSSYNSSDLPIPAMQQLLNEGSGAIYQITKQFRDDEIDRRHHSEFSVVQWSQSDWSIEQVLIDVTALLSAIFAGEFEPERRTFRQAFIQRLGFDPDERSFDELRQEARRLGLKASINHARQAWLKLMFIHFIEPTLGIDIPLYLTELPLTWRNESETASPKIAVSHADVYIDGIKVGSVLESVSEDDDSKDSTAQSNLNIVFGLDRLLMIVLETRQINKVLSIV